MPEPRQEDPHFIGWLPMPLAYRRFLLPVAAALVLSAAAVAATVAFLQRDPGTGTWDSDHVQTVQGIAFDRPYAMIRVLGTNPNEPPRTLLLVEEGKFGAQPRVERIVQGRAEGQAVQVKGTLLHRDGRAMLELAAGEASLQVLTAEGQHALPFQGPGMRQVIEDQVTLHGEIIDPKCYLGAMKPGGGKTHKACATLCISGGIPPMLVARAPDGHETFYLLTTTEGGPANELVLPFVGDAVAITGRLVRQDDLLLLQLAPDGVRRR